MKKAKPEKIIKLPEIAPCPFCGTSMAVAAYANKRRMFWLGEDEPKGKTPKLASQFDITGELVWCEQCGATGPSHKSMRSAIKAWNTRKQN